MVPIGRRAAHPPRARPGVLLLVYGASLLLTVFTIAGLALLVSEHVTASALRSAVSADQSLVRGLLAQALHGNAAALAADPARAADASAKLGSLVDGEAVLLARAIGRDGTVLASDRPRERGLRIAIDPRLGGAFEGRSSADIVSSGGLRAPAGQPVVVEYWPIATGGTVQAVFELRRDAGPILRDVDAIRRDVVVVAASAALTLALLLYLIFRAVQTRLVRQTHELVESGRRDALTRLLNHGTTVRVLEEQLEIAREDGSAVGIALVDIDNFRLLNDVHGHAAGDVVLRSVAEALELDSSSWSAIGRYGPDEFLVTSRAGAARDLE
ncbi:MAG: GGDEF domain-containing protein, partial [Chloroflexota bacterium]|nr:GGDEF domain-containing protein [Chloroflexota bacterium]